MIFIFFLSRGLFFLPSMPRPSALVTQTQIRENSMSAYKQPNAKFMSCGISCSVINYRLWFQVKNKKKIKRPTAAAALLFLSETV